jgi:hypothetical protein
MLRGRNRYGLGPCRFSFSGGQILDGVENLCRIVSITAFIANADRNILQDDESVFVFKSFAIDQPRQNCTVAILASISVTGFHISSVIAYTVTIKYLPIDVKRPTTPISSISLASGPMITCFVPRGSSVSIRTIWPLRIAISTSKRSRPSSIISSLACADMSYSPARILSLMRSITRGRIVGISACQRHSTRARRHRARRCGCGRLPPAAS